MSLAVPTRLDPRPDDSTQTFVCTCLSALLLVGLVLNATLGWGWADPLAGFVIAVVDVKEGREAWRGEACGCGPATGQAVNLPTDRLGAD